MANTGNEIGVEITVTVSGVPTVYTIPFGATVDEIAEITGLNTSQAQSLFDNRIRPSDDCNTCFEPVPPNEFYVDENQEIVFDLSLTEINNDVEVCISEINLA